MMRRMLAIGLATAPLSTALAAPVDCAALKSSTVPYELKIAFDGAMQTTSQVYRGEALKKTVMSSVLGKVTKSTFQAGFMTSMQVGDGKFNTFRYDVPTDKYFFDQGLTHAHVEAEAGGKATGSDQTFHVIGTEDVTVAPCVFRAVHFTVTTTANLIDIDSELWLAKDIDAIVRSNIKTTIKNGGQVITHRSEAQSIATDFAPLVLPPAPASK